MDPCSGSTGNNGYTSNVGDLAHFAPVPAELDRVIAAEVKQQTPCEKLIHTVFDEYFEGDRIQNYLRIINITSAKQLEQNFYANEIETMSLLMDWYHLSLLGYLPGPAEEQPRLKDVLTFLGVESVFQVFDPKCPRYFLNRLVQSLRSSRKVLFTDFIKVLKFNFINLLQAEKVEQSIEYYIAPECAEFLTCLSPLFNRMRLESLFSWTLFISISSFFPKDIITSTSFLEQACPWLCHIPEPLHPLLALMENFYKGQIGDPTTQQKPPPYVPPPQFARPNVAGLPNWMPNGYFTCYMSSTLWPLALLIPDKIEACIAGFAHISYEQEIAKEVELAKAKAQAKGEDVAEAQAKAQEQAQAEARAKALAREAFTQLYRKIASPNIEAITKAEVNSFREAMQQAFPKHFSAAPFAQECAFQFLSCVLDNLLLMNYGDQIFYISRTFKRENEETPLVEPELYDYTEAVAPYYAKDPSSILVVRLPEKKEHTLSFSQLATQARDTDVITRTAKQNTNPDKPEEQIIQALPTDQYVVHSHEQAPEFFCGILPRFSVENAAASKCSHPVEPSLTVEFQIIGEPGKPSEKTVTYDLVATTVHDGDTLNLGHYYTYFRHAHNDGDIQLFKYCDLNGPEINPNRDAVLSDTTKNGYIFYYKKRVQ